MSAATRQRTRILEAFKTRLNTLFNSKTGTEQKLFRAVWRRQLVPAGETMFPAVTVVDDGQRRGDETDQEEVGETRVLGVRIVLHLADKWESEAATRDWSDNVDLVDRKLRGRPGLGILDIRYQNDDPFDVVFMSGAQEAVWVLDYEVEYVAEVAATAAW